MCPGWESGGPWKHAKRELYNCACVCVCVCVCVSAVISEAWAWVNLQPYNTDSRGGTILPMYLVCASFFFSFFPLSLFRAAPVAYGSFQARGTAAGLHHSHSTCGIRAASVIYTTAHGNTGSPIHWARPGIETASSWILVGFVTDLLRHKGNSFVHASIMCGNKHPFLWSICLRIRWLVTGYVHL